MDVDLGRRTLIVRCFFANHRTRFASSAVHSPSRTASRTITLPSTLSASSLDNVFSDSSRWYSLYIGRQRERFACFCFPSSSNPFSSVCSATFANYITLKQDFYCQILSAILFKSISNGILHILLITQNFLP